MRSSPSGFWHALEAVSGCAAVDAEWKTQFEVDYGFGKQFLRPTSKLASSYPCAVANGCGCEHEVVIHAHEDIVAVCRCERGCDTFRLSRSDIVVYELNRPALDGVIAKTFDLMPDNDGGTGLRGTTRIGVYSPFTGFRFPAYLTIQIESEDFDGVIDSLLARNDKPFLLLSSTRTLCSTETEMYLTSKGSIFVPLSENVLIDNQQQLQLLRPVDEIFDQFRSTNLPPLKEEGAQSFFPTPSDAIWADVVIRFKDGHTVSIKVKSVNGMFNYTQMGMVNKKNGNPTVQWDLLKTFADERGILDWTSTSAHRRNQKRRELLATNLRRFFRIEGDPFRLTDDGKGWQTRFLVTPDE